MACIDAIFFPALQFIPDSKMIGQQVIIITAQCAALHLCWAFRIHILVILRSARHGRRARSKVDSEWLACQDTGGAGRASCCGCFGVRTTWGRVRLWMNFLETSWLHTPSSPTGLSRSPLWMFHTMAAKYFRCTGCLDSWSGTCPAMTRSSKPWGRLWLARRHGQHHNGLVVLESNAASNRDRHWGPGDERRKAGPSHEGCYNERCARAAKRIRVPGPPCEFHVEF